MLIGSSRVLFDVQLPRMGTRRPASGRSSLRWRAPRRCRCSRIWPRDPDFTGRLLVGVAPDLFFSGFAYRGEVIAYYHKQGPSQRSGHWLSKHLLEPYFAFYDPDFALATVRSPPGLAAARRACIRARSVRKLMEQDADRNT